MRIAYSTHAPRELLADSWNTALVGSRSAAQLPCDEWNREERFRRSFHCPVAAFTGTDLARKIGVPWEVRIEVP
jgi:hypothetical protein